MDKKSNRNSSIEMLRIIAMIGVVILHYNNHSLGGALKFVQTGTLQEKYLFFSESLFICAVNLFVMISAYFLSVTQKRKFVKIVELLVQLVLFQLLFYVIELLVGTTTFSFHGIILSLLPSHYFVVFYVILYIVSPYINVMLKNIDKRNFKRLVIILFLLFSVYATFTDFLENIFGRISGSNTVGIGGDQAGYTIVNFVLVYFVGAYIRVNEISISKKKSVLGIIVCIALIYLEKIVGQAFYKSDLAWQYNNPLLIVLPVFLILFFTKVEFKSKTINELAKAAFTCYLFHGYLLPIIGVEKFVNGNIFVLILHQFGSAMAIYLISYAVYKVYHLLTNPIFKRLEPKFERINISL